MVDTNRTSVEDKLKWMKTQLDMVSRTLVSIQSQIHDEKNIENESSDSSSSSDSESESPSSSESESYNSYDSDTDNTSDGDYETRVDISGTTSNTYIMVELEEL